MFLRVQEFKNFFVAKLQIIKELPKTLLATIICLDTFFMIGITVLGLLFNDEKFLVFRLLDLVMVNWVRECPT